jgi:homoserine kinase
MNSSSGGKTQSSRKVVVVAPASSANLGPGFDVFAIALERPLDRLTLSVEKSSRTEAFLTLRGVSDVSVSVEKNAASYVALSIARERGIHTLLRIELKKGIPVGVGLGSSAASSVAAALAVNELFELGMSQSELLRYASLGEKLSSGVAHYDNVAASLVGGFSVAVNGDRPRIISYSPPRSLKLCFATPVVTLPERKTEFARSLLPSVTKLSDVVHNLSMASAIVSGFARGDVELIGYGMHDDIVEPARARMIPGFQDVRRAAIRGGATGVCISGAGPTVLAVTDSRRTSPPSVLKAMLSAFRDAGVKATGFITKVGRGARVVSS